jgi:1,5-anhydro-D-fructose reductase (1,5-anhydro-D-mannitol-forming)
MAATPTLGWGLIGASDIAQTRMIPAIAAQPDSRVVAVMSSSPERGRAYAERNEVPAAYDALDALLADPAVDAVYISTTNELHAAATIAAAHAGKHVLCEKPLATTLDDAHAMAAACRDAGVVFGTNHHLRNAATHRTMRRLIEEGAIGDVLAARAFHAISLPEHLHTWRVSRAEAGGGVIFDITVHDTDVLRFLLGREVLEVVALTIGGIEDSVMGVMRFEGDVLASFHDSFVIGHAGTGLEVHGTTGSLIAREAMTGEPTGDVLLRRGAELTHVDVGPRESLYVRALRAFHAAIGGEGAPAVSGDDGIRSLAVALAVRESAASGRRVQVAPSSSPVMET